MLDEVVADNSTARKPLEAPSPEIRLQPDDALFGPSPPTGTKKDSAAGDTPSLPPPATSPEIKLQPADGLLGQVSLKDDERASTPKGESLLGRLSRHCAYAAVLAGCCGLAWAAGAHHSLGRWPFDVATASPTPDVQPSPPRDDVLGAVRQLAEEMRALEAGVAAKDPAQQKSQANAVPPAAGPATADLAGRVDKLDAKLTAKLSQINEQLASLGQQISASRGTAVARAQPPQKRAKHIHDAFDPSKDPNAPGSPRPLGSW